MVASPEGLGPDKDRAGKGQQHIKIQTRPLVREGALQKHDRNCQRVINNWSWAQNGARHQDLLTDWLTVSYNVTVTLTLTVQLVSAVQLSCCKEQMNKNAR
jgi:hypothetical protein